MSYGKSAKQFGFKGDGFDLAELALLSSGYVELDNKLSGGWSSGVVADILYGEADAAELKVLLPTLAQLSKQQERWVLWVAPPVIPDGKILEMAGIDLSRVLVVRADLISKRVATIERALSGGECSAVVAWPGEISKGDLNRLEMATKKGSSYCYLMRESESAISEASAELRVQLTAEGGGTGVELMRRPDGWPLPRFVIDTNSVSGRVCRTNIIAGPWSN